MASEADKDFIALTLLAEARGGGMAGMSAVAFVIRNRAGSGLYDSDPYNVVTDPSQFDGATDVNIDRARTAAKNDPKLYNTARVIVDQIIYADEPPPDITGGALFFHATGHAWEYADDVETSHGTTNIGGNTFYPRETPGNMAQTAVVITRAVAGQSPPSFETASEAVTRVGTSPSVPGGVVNPPSTRMAYAEPVIIDVTGGGVLSNGYVAPATPFTTPRNAPITGIVFHHTVSSTVSSAFVNANSKRTGAQYYIDRDGTVYQYASDGTYVDGIRNPNDPFRTDRGSFSEKLDDNSIINVEIVGALTGEDDITPEQIEAATALAVKLADKYNIDPAMILGHGEIQGGPGGNKLSWEGLRAAASARLALTTGGYVPNFVRPEGPAAGMPGAASARLGAGSQTTDPAMRNAISSTSVSASIERMKNDVVVSQGAISRKRMAEADVFGRMLLSEQGIEQSTAPILIADEFGNQVDIIDRRPTMDAAYDPVAGAFVTFEDFKLGRRGGVPTGVPDLSAIDLAIGMNIPAVATDQYDGIFNDTSGRVVLTPEVVKQVRAADAFPVTAPIIPARGTPVTLPMGSLPGRGTTVAGRPDAPVGSMPAAERPPASPAEAAKPYSPSYPKVEWPPQQAIGPVITGRPDAPIGAMPAAPSPPPLPRSRPAQSSDVPDISEERRVTASGQEVDLGMIYEIGGQFYTAEAGAGNSAVLRKLPPDQQLILREVGANTIAGGIIRDTAGRLISDALGRAAPMVEATIRGFDALVGSGQTAPVFVPRAPSAGDEIEAILDSYKVDGAVGAARTAVERARTNPATRPLVTMPVAPPTRTPSTLPIAPPPARSSSSSSSSSGTLVVSPPPRPVGALPAARPQTVTTSSVTRTPVTMPIAPAVRTPASLPIAPPVTREVTITKQVPVVSYVRPEGPAAGMPAARVQPLPPPTQTIDPAMRNAISTVQPGLIPPPAPVAMPKPKPVKVVTYKTVTVKKKITVAAPTTGGGNPVTMPIAAPRPTTYTSGGYLYRKNANGGYTNIGRDPNYVPKVNNYGAGGFTSSGQSKTLPSGESWAAGTPVSATGGGPAAGGEYGGR